MKLLPHFYKKFQYNSAVITFARYYAFTFYSLETEEENSFQLFMIFTCITYIYINTTLVLFIGYLLVLFLRWKMIVCIMCKIYSFPSVLRNYSIISIFKVNYTFIYGNTFIV